MMITLPSAEEIEQYGVHYEPGPTGMPRIADEEAVCRVFTAEGGSGGYWSRGDVDVHILHAKQHGLVPSPVAGIGEGIGQQAWLAGALRERREQRLRRQRAGVQTTTGGLVLLQRPRAQLVVPIRR